MVNKNDTPGPLVWNRLIFYSSPKYWPLILPTVYVWNRIGYSSIVFFAAVIGIDRELYEAAVVDGANKARQVMHMLALPMLKTDHYHLGADSCRPYLYADFGLFYQVPMNSGALFDVTNVIDTYVYWRYCKQRHIQSFGGRFLPIHRRLYHGDADQSVGSQDRS